MITISPLIKHHLIEGRSGSLFLSAEVAKNINEEAQYIKNKGFDDRYYKDLIIEYLRTYHRASKENMRSLLLDKLPDSKTTKQREDKIHNLLSSLRQKGIIKQISASRQKSIWVLTEEYPD